MAKIKTKLCESLGIEYPIIQAGMGYLALAELCAAVSNAGGLGVIGGTMCTPEELREEIRKVKSLTNKPFGVDLLIPSPAPGSDQIGKQLSTEYDLPLADADTIKKQVEVVFEERVPVFISGLGNPSYLVPDAHAIGMKVMALVGDVKNAALVAEGGVDFVIAQGHEGGGHTGKIATTALIPQVVQSVNVPVVAAGGIASGAGLVAALAFGACGVWIGTRFVATKESKAHQSFKEEIVKANANSTIVTRAYTGKTTRAIKNKYISSWENRINEIKPFPLQFSVSGERMNSAMIHGEIEEGFMPAGQISGLISDIPSASDLVKKIMEEASETVGKINSTLQS